MREEYDLSAERFMTVEAIVRETGGDRTRLLDVLLAVQEQFGFISDDAIRAISAGLHIHPVEVEDTLSFYAFLNRKPKGDFSSSGFEDAGFADEGRTRGDGSVFERASSGMDERHWHGGPGAVGADQ